MARSAAYSTRGREDSAIASGTLGSEPQQRPGIMDGAMKFLFDLFPIILFFAAFKLFDIYTATAAAIAATVLQIGGPKWRRKKVDTMMWVSVVIIVVFGGATLALHDETFLQWKPTVL